MKKGDKDLCHKFHEATWKTMAIQQASTELCINALCITNHKRKKEREKRKFLQPFQHHDAKPVFHNDFEFDLRGRPRGIGIKI